MWTCLLAPAHIVEIFRLATSITVGFDYYEAFDADIASLIGADCGVHYQFNDTKDAFLAALSPLMPYQLAPFHRGIFSTRMWESLRPDHRIEQKKQEAKDMAIFTEVAAAKVNAYHPPPGYYVARRRRVPGSLFFTKDEWLFILAPNACAAGFPAHD